MTKALAIAEEIQAKPHLSDLCLSLSQLYRMVGKHEPTLDYYERSHQGEKEVFNTESDRRIQTLIVQLRIERNKLLTTVRHSLERLAEVLSAENRTTIKEILNSMKSNDPTIEREIFSDKYQDLHGEFAQILAKMYPDLSPTELKICALTKVHFSTKEIAAILQTSIRTVEAHRYRLRKKLDIPPTK